MSQIAVTVSYKDMGNICNYKHSKAHNHFRKKLQQNEPFQQNCILI